MNSNTTLSLSDGRKAMRNAIFAQCFGMLGISLFENGVMLLYLLALGVSQARVMTYLALPSICLISTIPAAYYAERIGKKKIGGSGNLLCVAGMMTIASAGFSPGMGGEVLVIAGTILLSLGISMFQSSWFALLGEVVPSQYRGRFFGTLRISWQMSCMLVAGAAAWVLGRNNAIWIYQSVIAVVAVLMLGRSVFYNRIPEIHKKMPPAESFRKALTDIVYTREFSSFGAYVFLLKIFTAYCPTIFAVLEKEVLNLPAGTVIWLANVGLGGSVIGFFVGGRLVDRIGTKLVFIICHISFAVILLLFILRGIGGSTILLPMLFLAHFTFNLALAASNIAITAETIMITPEKNSSLASSVLMGSASLGTAAAGMTTAAVLNLDFLKDSWQMLGLNLCKYDVILMVCAVMVVMLVVTLGLVPSVLVRPRPDGTDPGCRPPEFPS